MEIRPFDPADPGALDRAHALLATAHRVDHPELPLRPKHVFAAETRFPPPRAELRVHTALDGERTLGLMTVYLPAGDNAHYAEAEITVHPEHRRRGVGTALLDHLLATARAEARTEVVVIARGAWKDGPKRSTDGPEFLERRGFALALTEVDHRMAAAGLDEATERSLRSDAEAAAGEEYALVRWTGRTPPEHREGLGRIDSMIFDEVPLGEVDLRGRTIDADFVRVRDDRDALIGRTALRTLAVHKSSGAVAANTALFAFADEPDAYQGITIVDPAHRGHRLGMLVKLANLRLLRERFPHVTAIWTGNADVNAHMLAINEALGFAPVDARLSYKRTVER